MAALRNLGFRLLALRRRRASTPGTGPTADFTFVSQQSASAPPAADFTFVSQ